MSPKVESVRGLAKDPGTDWGGAFSHAVSMLLIVLTLAGIAVAGGWIDGQVFGDRTDTWSTVGSKALKSLFTGLAWIVLMVFVFRLRLVRRHAVRSFALLWLALTLFSFGALLADPLPWWQEFGLMVALVFVLLACGRILKAHWPEFWFSADRDELPASKGGSL